jgi:transposase InsO family protein
MLGHSNVEYVKKFLKVYNIAADSISLNKIKNCVTCAEGKQSRPPFERSVSQTSEILELVHTDVMGPMETKTISGARYIVTFLDDYSGMVFVYFLKEKSEVYDFFVRFKTLVENQTGKKIKKLRSDNGTEYTSNKMMSYIKENGILHQKTAPYTPQQIGKAERMNRTLVEKAKCLLFDANLPKKYWAEAVNMATFLVNNTFMDKNDKTPSEIFYNKKVDMSNLKLFGSKVMVQIPKVKRRKWDKNSRELIFVGYDAETKAYRCVDKNTGQLTLSRDVIFHDNAPNLEKDRTIEIEEDEDVVKLEISTDSDSAENREVENHVETDADDTKSTNEEGSHGETDEDDAALDESTYDDPDYEPERRLGSPEVQSWTTRAATKANVRINQFGYNFICFHCRAGNSEIGFKWSRSS